jgi:hypothetical protein
MIYKPAVYFIVLATLFICRVHARAIYIDPSLKEPCKDTTYSVASRTCSGSDGLAYNMFSEVSEKLLPGDTVLFRGGVYSRPIIVRSSGSSSAHLRLQAHSGEPILVDLSGASGDVSGIDVSGRQYVDIDGISITNAPLYGFNAQSAANVSLSHCEVSFSRHGGVIAVSSSHIHIEGCKVHHNNQGGPSSMMEAVSLQNVDTFQVMDCEVYSNGKEGIDAKYGSTNGSITGNFAYRNAATNIYLDGTNNIAVEKNVAYEVASADKAGIGVAVEAIHNYGKDPTFNIEIANNVVYGNAAGITFWFENSGVSWATISNVRVEYNTIVDNNLKNWGGLFFMNGTASNYGLGNIIRNNVFWHNATKHGAKAIRDDAHVRSLFLTEGTLFEQGEPSATCGSD